MATQADDRDRYVFLAVYTGLMAIMFVAATCVTCHHLSALLISITYHSPSLLIITRHHHASLTTRCIARGDPPDPDAGGLVAAVSEHTAGCLSARWFAKQCGVLDTSGRQLGLFNFWKRNHELLQVALATVASL
jgi:hypothetical protein